MMTQYVQEKVEVLERPVTAWALLGAIGVLLFAYAFLINGTITNIVAAKDAQSHATALESAVSGLESKYLALESSLGLDSALASGYVVYPVDDVAYVSSRTDASLSFNR